MENEIQAFLSSLESQPNYSQSTRLAYRSDMRSFYEFLCESLQRVPTLADFDAEHAAAFLERERLSGRRLGTLLRRRATLRRFENFLVQERYLPAKRLTPNTRLLEQPLSSLPRQKPPICLSEAQIQRLWDCLSESQRSLARRDHALLAVLLETGMSVSTLIAIDLNEVDLRAGKIYACSSDQEGSWLPLGGSVETIATYLQIGRPELTRSNEEPALFISQIGTRMSRQSAWQVLRHWGEVAELPVLLSPRLLRHTAALRMARAGRSIAEIQILLGHSNPLSTQALLHRLEFASRTM
jgi:integrase/recombinase XerD